MSEFMTALHAFLEERDKYAAAVREGTSLEVEQKADRAMTQAEGALEAALREMQEKAVRDRLARMQHLPADLYEALNSHD